MSEIDGFLNIITSINRRDNERLEVAAEARRNLARSKAAKKAKGKTKRLLSMNPDEVIVRKLKKW